MNVNYNKLWEMLIDKNMMKKDLRVAAGVTTNVMAKLGKNEHVSTEVLCKICEVLGCFQYITNCHVPENGKEGGWDVIYKNADGVTLPDGDVVHFNTYNGFKDYLKDEEVQDEAMLKRLYEYAKKMMN